MPHINNENKKWWWFCSYIGPPRVGCWFSLASLSSILHTVSLWAQTETIIFFSARLVYCSLFRVRLWWLNYPIETYPRSSYILHCPHATIGHGPWVHARCTQQNAEALMFLSTQ